MPDDHVRGARPGWLYPEGKGGSQPGIRPNPQGDWPEVDGSAYLDPTAQIIGRVRIGPHVFVGPHAAIRADEVGAAGSVEPVEVAAECNIQDGVIVHSLGGAPVLIGARTSLSHGCVVHGPCQVGQDGFIGFRAVVFNARLGDGVFVGAGAVVQGVELPSGCLVPPGRTVVSAEQVAGLAKAGPAERDFARGVVTANRRLAEGYRST